MNLFRHGKFRAASGHFLKWKAECDAFTEEDWECLAQIANTLVRPFSEVHGVPTGGEKFAFHMRQFITPEAGSILLVDDVYTTGKSMKAFARELGLKPMGYQACVVFNRSNESPDNLETILFFNSKLCGFK